MTASSTWKRLAPGYYERQRGEHLDQVSRVQYPDDGTHWVFLIDGEGGHDVYFTRREATDALDAWIAEHA